MRTTRLQYDWKPIFLASLREVPVVSRAATAAGVDRTTAYAARDTDEQFTKAWDEAMEDGVDVAEAEAFRRAVQGFEEPVVYQGSITPRMAPMFDVDGKPVIDDVTKTQKWGPVLDENGVPVPLTVRRHSDTLLTVILKGRRKKVYAERTELTGADGGPVAHLDDATRTARVAQLLAAAASRREADDGVCDLA